jgi:hypothetical protein
MGSLGTSVFDLGWDKREWLGGAQLEYIVGVFFSKIICPNIKVNQGHERE